MKQILKGYYTQFIIFASEKRYDSISNINIKEEMKMIKVSSINASSLFHFTNKISSLKLILKNGLCFLYAFEKFSNYLISNFCDVKCIDQDLGVAIPMICFCDTPITRTYKHMNKYGQYMIGFDKDFLLSYYGNILNPVFYIQSPNMKDAVNDISDIYAETSKEHAFLVQNKSFDQTRITSLGLRKYNLRFIIGMCKPISCYDEREWRLIRDDNHDQLNEWIWGISEAKYRNIKNELNEKLLNDFDSHLTLLNEDNIRDAITHIVVKDESEVPKLVKYIMKSQKLFGNENVSDKVKMHLVSKTTSVKRIILDY